MHRAASERASVDPVLPDTREAAGASSAVPRSAASVPGSINLGVPGRMIRKHPCRTASPLSTHALAPCFQDGRYWAPLLVCLSLKTYSIASWPLLAVSLQETCPPLELDAGEGLRDSSLLTQPSRDGVRMELSSAGVSKSTHILTTSCLLRGLEPRECGNKGM